MTDNEPTRVDVGELRRYILRMLRAGRGEKVDPETPEGPLETRAAADADKPPTRRRTSPKSRKQAE